MDSVKGLEWAGLSKFQRSSASDEFARCYLYSSSEWAANYGLWFVGSGTAGATGKNSDNICVIGVFGKGASGSQSKGLLLNKLFDSDVFECHVESYYDEANRTLYLHLVSVYDASQLAHLCRNLPQHSSPAECHAYWKGHEGHHARLMLFLFTVCHILIVFHPRAVFDTSYVKLFRALQATREKLAPHLSASLKSHSLSRQWQTSGRMCTPRLLFICQQNDLTRYSRPDEKGNEAKGKKKSPRKVLQLHLEDQIYRIFRKTHILTNNMSHCLFSIPLNQGFVHILNRDNELKDPVHELIKSYQIISETRGSPRDDSRPFVMPITVDSMPSLTEKNKDTLRSFVDQHANLILAKKGFDDSFRGATIAHFEYPTLKTWIDVATSLYDVFVNPSDDPKQTASLTYLQTALDQDLRFSEMRCKKILPMASRMYQETASSHYTSTVHRNKLMQAMHTYSQHARGPAYETFALQLQEECERFWQSGRQLCEVVSLTGHHCIHKLHLLPTDPEMDTPRDVVLTRTPHTNNNQTPCACNCGRSSGTREDPFDLKVANLDFFEELEEKCCKDLRHINFPVYIPSPSRRPSEVTRDEEEEVQESRGKDDDADDVDERDEAEDEEDEEEEEETEKMEETGLQEDLSTKAVEKIKFSTDMKGSESGMMTPDHSLGQSAAEGSLPTGQTIPHTSESSDVLSGEHQDDVSAKEETDDADGSGSQFSSPLQGMLCSTSPRGMLPAFSSWSLICLGPSSLYHPSKGLDQRSFLRESKHLLPWDIPIPKGAVLDSHWPSPSETVSTSKKGGRGRDKKDGSDGLRAYIGNEYECPRGHRFICSGPDKVVKVPSGSGGPKESGNKLVTSDVPLHFPCPCRSNKPPLGQLIRTFVVTPPGPVFIKLNPKVRPGPHPTPIFYPLPGEVGVTLSASSMWVLRYPFVYMSEAGAVMPPTDNQPTPGAKLLKGLFLVTLQPPQS
ncbi:nonsense-mediated mRNA decay factor SMG8-like [Diadema setosum]|uniref:nonsense-mediated mRNA decay factor SMG8-like n=1 Tax=Diadema setosum TaxID=31175 RepID=UPI003B3B6E1A